MWMDYILYCMHGVCEWMCVCMWERFYIGCMVYVSECVYECEWMCVCMWERFYIGCMVYVSKCVVYVSECVVYVSECVYVCERGSILDAWCMWVNGRPHVVSCKPYDVMWNLHKMNVISSSSRIVSKCIVHWSCST